MSSTGIPPLPSVQSIAANSAAGSTTSLWTRLSGYISEHKAAVYTVGAVVVVATAGGIYYISQSGPSEDEPGREKKSKKDRRKKDVKEAAAEKAEKTQGGRPNQDIAFQCAIINSTRRCEKAGCRKPRHCSP
jgi:import receptor subunit TOM70